jgi:hypothetical protein
VTETLALDEGLLTRLRSAGRAIAWRDAPARARRTPPRRGRIAHLHDEEARVETWGTDRSGGLAADAGPVGALVLLLEADRRGVPTDLGAWNSGTDPAFPQGAVVAAWGRRLPRRDSSPRLADLVELARYALG